MFLPKPVDPQRLLEESARLIEASDAAVAEGAHAGGKR
jgi:hypothetical protein